MVSRLRDANKAEGEGVKRRHPRDRRVRAFPAPEANAELPLNIIDVRPMSFPFTRFLFRVLSFIPRKANAMMGLLGITWGVVIRQP